MAENITMERRNKGGRRSQKKSTRVDLTPMVDLGFLLITFFVFTSALSEPKVMNMAAPIDKGPNTAICASCALTVLATADNRLYYYEGDEKDAVYQQTNYGAEGLRALMMKKKKAAAAIGRDAIMIIKPGDSASFKNMVDLIDEANITMYKNYYLDGMTAHEKMMVGK